MAKTITQRLEKLQADYLKNLEAEALEIFKEKVIPVCKREALVYATLNGSPRFYGKDGGRMRIPAKLRQLFQCPTPEGDPLFWLFPDYNPDSVDISALDIAEFNASPALTDEEAALSCWQAMHR